MGGLYRQCEAGVNILQIASTSVPEEFQKVQFRSFCLNRKNIQGFKANLEGIHKMKYPIFNIPRIIIERVVEKLLRYSNLLRNDCSWVGLFRD